MSSPLRMSIDSQSTQSFYPTMSPRSPLARKPRMSLTQIYRVASSARGKLGREASRSDHDLRLLVGHANLLDSLMVELADTEREQESWFNESLRKTSKPEAPRHVQWADAIAEELEEDSDDDSDDEEDVYGQYQYTAAPRRASPPPPTAFAYSEAEYDEDDEDDMDYEDDEEHSLQRVPSHSPPELIHEDSDSSDDESMPASPPNSAIELSEKQRQAIATTSFFDKVQQEPQADYYNNDLIRSSESMITAY